MNQHYQNKTRLFFSRVSLFLLALLPLGVLAQITVSTNAGSNYSGGLGTQAGTPGAVTFVLQNNNSQAVIVKKIDYYAATTHPDNVYKLWYSTTSLSGQATIASPNWTLVATGNPVTATANGVMTVLDNLDNLNISIPANTQYRFALETTVGIVYSGASTATTPPLPLPTPNTFTSGGVTLKVGGSSISGSAVGYGGAFPTPANTPRFFTGSVTLGFCASSAPATVPTVSADTVLCGTGGSATLRVTGGNLNDAANWKWYTGSCGGTAVGTGASITVTPTATTTYYVRGEGGCASAPGTCAAINVAVRPVPGTPTINPVTPICAGSLQALTINPLAVTPASVTVNSAASLALAIPDNIATGASTSLTVAGVPAGATVTGVDVILNITHTYVSDLIINLRAPNGQIANLDKYVTGTGNEGEDFVNTMITSDVSAPALSTGTAPYSGVFKADLINANVGTGVQNPTGFVANATSFSSLFTTPNGTWTLAMADGGPADVGTLNNWSIIVHYTTSAPANPAVWTPGATLYNDAAGTIPYDGVSPRFQVYAKPAVTTTYSAASVLNGCSSAAATVDVTVNNPAVIASTTIPADVRTCASGTAMFKAAATGTAPSYQWQVSVNGGAFTDIVNDANYDGAATDSLSVKSIPATWTGNMYRCKVTSTTPCTDVVYSREARLTVDENPVVTLSLNGNANMLPGMVSTLSVSSDTTAVSYSWFNNGAAYAEANGSTTNVTINNQGVFEVQVTDKNGCTGVSNAITIQDSVSNKLFIYPNPAPNKQFIVSFYSAKGNTSLARQLVIYDAKGTKVYSQSYNVDKPYSNMNVDFSRMGRGIYVVNLLDRFGKRLATGKVVVK